MTQTLQLPGPTPGTPVLVRMVSSELIPETEPRKMDVACPNCGAQHRIQIPIEKKSDRTIVWQIKEPHPLTKGVRVVRMFITDDGVEVYSVSDDGSAGVRNLVPMAFVRLTEELMTPNVLINELVEAEEDNVGGLDDDDDEEEEEPEGAPSETATTQSDQTTG